MGIERVDPMRIVALGASNLSLGLESLLVAARAEWGNDIEVMAAPGYGRSYGAPSRILFRTLPGLLECGLWNALGEQPRAATRALVTDVGNDILYGVPPQKLLEWVEEAAGRLLTHTSDVVITTLPVSSVRALSPGRFIFFRSLFFPSSRVTREDAVAGVQQVDEGLQRLAERRHVRLVPLLPEWYGFDPIHIHPRYWAVAWSEVVLGRGNPEGGLSRPAAFSMTEFARLHAMVPERRWIAGLRGGRPQTGRRLPRGGRLWLF